MNTTPSLPNAAASSASSSGCRIDLTKDMAEEMSQRQKLPPGEAIERIEEVLPVLLRLDDPKSIYPAYITLVRSHLILGSHDRAASIIKEVEEAGSRLHAPLERGHLLNFLCGYYATATQCDLAKAYNYNFRSHRCA